MCPFIGYNVPLHRLVIANYFAVSIDSSRTAPGAIDAEAVLTTAARRG
jgi:hypothetical protein